MRDPVEVLVDEVRHAGTATEQLDEREPVDGTGQLAATSLVDAQHGWQARDRRLVNVKRVRQQLADAGSTARSIHGVLVAGREQQGVRLSAAGLVRSEERADVVPQFVGQHAEPGALGKRSESEVDEDVGPALFSYAVPAVGTRDTPKEGKRPRYAAKHLRQRRGRRELASNGEAATLGDEGHEGIERCLVVGDEILALPDIRGRPLTRHTVHSERLFVGVVPENVEDARSRRDWTSVKRPLDPLA